MDSRHPGERRRTASFHQPAECCPMRATQPPDSDLVWAFPFETRRHAHAEPCLHPQHRPAPIAPDVLASCHIGTKVNYSSHLILIKVQYRGGRTPLPQRSGFGNFTALGPISSVYEGSSCSSGMHF